MVKIKNEKLFNLFYKENTIPTENGRLQFFQHQSHGKIPKKPDPYYTALVKGKENFDFLCSEYHNMYFSDYWWGFLRIYEDWKGNEWVVPHLCKWHTRPIPKLEDIKRDVERVTKKYGEYKWPKKC